MVGLEFSEHEVATGVRGSTEVEESTGVEASEAIEVESLIAFPAFFTWTLTSFLSGSLCFNKKVVM